MRSLREGTRAQAVRAARTCYDHLAGRLGVALMSGMVERGVLTGGDGQHARERARADRPSAIGRDLDYRLTDGGARRLRDLGVDVDGALAGPRAPIRYCVDWSEQDHHLRAPSARPWPPVCSSWSGSRACRARAPCASPTTAARGSPSELGVVVEQYARNERARRSQGAAAIRSGAYPR